MNLQENIRKVLKEYIEEARLSDLLRVKGDKGELHKYIEKEKSKEFEVDRQLPTQVTLKKRYNNKKIKVFFSWFDNSKHDLKKRIKERTTFKNVSEFTEEFIKAINSVFPDQLGININENGRYALSLSEYGITVVFSVNLNNFDKNQLDINILTILPKVQIDMRNILYYFVY